MNYRVSPEHQRQPRNRPSEELVHRRAQAHPSPQGSMDLLRVGEERRKAQREGGRRCPLVLMLEGFIPVLCLARNSLHSFTFTHSLSRHFVVFLCNGTQSDAL